MKAKWILSFYIIIGLFAVYLAAILPNYNFITLSRSTGGVRVEYLRNYNGEMPRFSSELAHLYTEEEAFEISHSPAFQGKILSIRNIRALFHGESSPFDTFAIANVRVEKVFSGELSAGIPSVYCSPAQSRGTSGWSIWTSSPNAGPVCGGFSSRRRWAIPIFGKRTERFSIFPTWQTMRSTPDIWISF